MRQGAHSIRKTVTHLGIGVGQVEQVASNRRVLGPDGKVKYVRYSASNDPEGPRRARRRDRSRRCACSASGTATSRWP